MILGHHVARRKNKQDALHDRLAVEHEEVGGAGRQPGRNHDRHVYSGDFRFGAQFGSLTRLRLGHEALAMKTDSRLKSEYKHQKTHAQDKKALQPVAMFQQEAHASTVIQKQ